MLDKMVKIHLKGERPIKLAIIGKKMISIDLSIFVHFLESFLWIAISY
jgi:hypothetical protein